MRLTWAQPEDLLLHEFVQARGEGIDVSDQEQRWLSVAGGSLAPPVGGAGAEPATAEARSLAGRLMDEIDALPRPADPGHPDELADIDADLRAQLAQARTLDDQLGELLDHLGRPT